MIRANEELASYYESIVKKFLETSQVPEGYEGPFLAAAPKNYEQARFKWMYMGQQGNGFECVSSPSDVRGAMEGTASFQGNGGPFWQFGKELEKELNPGLVERSFVWSNIARIQKIKVDGRVPGELLDFWIRQRLTATEIETLHPMFVLFVTGPDYVDLLRTEFPGTDIPDLTPERPFAAFDWNGVLMMETYHPKWLRLNNLWEKKKSDIVRAVLEQ